MGKALFYHGLLFLTGTFLVSPTFTTDGTVQETKSAPKEDIWDEYGYLRIQYIPIDEDLAKKSWAIVEQNKKSVTVPSSDNINAKITTLSFGFKFYDATITTVMISTYGSMWPFDDASWSISPLLAGEASSSFKYLDTGDSFRVNWDNFILKNTTVTEEMNFQASLFEDGTIEFIYMKVPQNLALIAAKSQNEISIGVRYRLVEKLFDNRHSETFQLGHSIDMNEFKIQNGTVIRFEQLTSCTKNKDCQGCVNTVVPVNQTKKIIFRALGFWAIAHHKNMQTPLVALLQNWAWKLRLQNQKKQRNILFQKRNRYCATYRRTLPFMGS
ncbi:Hypothetical predicted protein [Cloeon dipterum]|uniref:Uncharacterized protein n=1 Tax=Cloeon dipterum TaxID=197152 RepID=A0A8S1DKK8_9INSE|nr:Hypothetical predicted protein [Cloeon dipterum]